MKANRFKKIICVMLSLVLICLCFTACGKKDETVSTEKPGTIITETDTEMTIVDQANREVTVKKNSKSIALCYRVVIRFLLSLNQGDKIKGIGKNEEFLTELQPSLADCKDVGKGVADIEALAELDPDLFFHKASDIETLEAVEKIGIPSVGIEVETPEDMIVALDLMGKVCEQQEKAEQLIDYYNSELKSIEKLTAEIEKKKTAVVMGSSIGKVADSTMLQGEMLERAGAVNCAADIEATELWPTAGAEQIFEWNPDYIFISNSESAVYSAEDIYKDKAWSEIKAVKNKHVYVIPAEKDSWEFPGVVSLLGIDYMIHQMYPKLMSDDELEQKVNELYGLSYGISFDKEELGY